MRDSLIQYGLVLAAYSIESRFLHTSESIFFSMFKSFSFALIALKTKQQKRTRRQNAHKTLEKLPHQTHKKLWANERHSSNHLCAIKSSKWFLSFPKLMMSTKKMHRLDNIYHYDFFLRWFNSVWIVAFVFINSVVVTATPTAAAAMTVAAFSSNNNSSWAFAKCLVDALSKCP